MGNTKKVGSTGRFGSKYGVGIRKRLLKVENSKEKTKPCVFCGFKKIKRKAAGLYECSKCGAEFTGGAYFPETLVGKSIKKMVSQKSFSSSKELEELMENKESTYSDIEKEVAGSVTK